MPARALPRAIPRAIAVAAALAAPLAAVALGPAVPPAPTRHVTGFGLVGRRPRWRTLLVGAIGLPAGLAGVIAFRRGLEPEGVQVPFILLLVGAALLLFLGAYRLIRSQFETSWGGRTGGWWASSNGGGAGRGSSWSSSSASSSSSSRSSSGFEGGGGDSGGGGASERY